MYKQKFKCKFCKLLLLILLNAASVELGLIAVSVVDVCRVIICEVVTAGEILFCAHINIVVHRSVEDGCKCRFFRQADGARGQSLMDVGVVG